MNPYITEKTINTMLQDTRSLADRYEEDGKRKLGLLILRIGSQGAEMNLRLIEYQYKPFQCGEMGHILKDKASQEFFIHTGVCLYCDHLRGDEMDDKNAFAESEEV